MIKRVFDFLLALVGILLLIPFFLLVGLWIKTDSQGNIIFSQKRIGRYGVPFRMYKLRTMYISNETARKLTIGDDPRITKAGKLLRKSKLDELPQLVNILLGNMSFVGPRPEVLEYVDEYPPAARKKILSVKPGLTDEASIMMINENEILKKYSDPEVAYIKIIIPTKINYYLDYVENRSFLGDLKIILKTIKKLFLS